MYGEDLLKDRVENSGFEYKRLGDDAYLIYDFLKEEERLAFLKLAEDTLPPEWCFQYLKELEETGLRNYGRSDIASLIQEGKLMLIPRNMDQVISTEPLMDLATEITDRVNKIFPPQYQSIRYGVIQRHYEGVGLEDHRDTDCNPNLKYATVVYLNNDFDGGEIYFKDDDLTMEIKPVPGSCIIFNANRLHGTNPVVGKSVRYVLTSFVSPVGDNIRFDKVANPINPTAPDRLYAIGHNYAEEDGEAHGDAALRHFLEQQEKKKEQFRGI
jgi:hypothetical protein